MAQREMTTKTNPDCQVGERAHGILGSGCICGQQPKGCKSPYCEPPWCKNCGDQVKPCPVT